MFDSSILLIINLTVAALLIVIVVLRSSAEKSQSETATTSTHRWWPSLACLLLIALYAFVYFNTRPSYSLFRESYHVHIPTTTSITHEQAAEEIIESLRDALVRNDQYLGEQTRDKDAPPGFDINFAGRLRCVRLLSAEVVPFDAPDHYDTITVSCIYDVLDLHGTNTFFHDTVIPMIDQAIEQVVQEDQRKSK